MSFLLWLCMQTVGYAFWLMFNSTVLNEEITKEYVLISCPIFFILCLILKVLFFH